MFYSLVLQCTLMVILVYVPKLNSFFMLDSLQPSIAASGLWMIPGMIIYDEIRKYFIRRDRLGWVARLTLL